MVRLSAAWPLSGGGDQRLLNGIFAVSEVTVAAQQHAENLRREFTQQVLGGLCGAHSSGSGALSICRTSIGWRIANPSGPGAADACAAISIARSAVSTSTSR